MRTPRAARAAHLLHPLFMAQLYSLNERARVYRIFGARECCSNSREVGDHAATAVAEAAKITIVCAVTADHRGAVDEDAVDTEEDDDDEEGEDGRTACGEDGVQQTVRDMVQSHANREEGHSPAPLCLWLLGGEVAPTGDLVRGKRTHVKLPLRQSAFCLLLPLSALGADRVVSNETFSIAGAKLCLLCRRKLVKR